MKKSLSLTAFTFAGRSSNSSTAVNISASIKPLTSQTKLLKVAIAFLAVSLFGFHEANAQSNLITVKSSKSFEATVSGIKKGVADAGMMVLSELNQGKTLAMTGLSIKAESLFIGNPNVGKQAFSENPAVGLAIPVRLNVYEDKGITYINYFTPSGELGKFQGTKVKMIGQTLDKKMSMLTGMFR